MGQEIHCKIRVGKATADGKALLESTEIIFRSPDLRLKIPFRQMTSIVADYSFLRDLKRRTTDVAEGKPVNESDVIFFGADRAETLAKLRDLRRYLKPNAALWVVYPKGQKHITEADVFASGHRAGLVDTKVAGFSATHTALKFVIPTKNR